MCNFKTMYDITGISDYSKKFDYSTENFKRIVWKNIDKMQETSKNVNNLMNSKKIKKNVHFAKKFPFQNKIYNICEKMKQF